MFFEEPSVAIIEPLEPSTEGALDGTVVVGRLVGASVGWFVGTIVGNVLGCREGAFIGEIETKSEDGASVGPRDGE